MVVLDTSALLFWTLDPAKLSKPAAAAITASSDIHISAISLWEIGIKESRGKLILPLTLRDFASRLQTVRGVEIAPVTAEIWMRNVELEWEHRDPADRTIVAMALMLNAPLVTSDRIIRSFYKNTVW